MRIKLWKRTCAFLLTVCVLMTMMPVTAWALTLEEIQSPESDWKLFGEARLIKNSDLQARMYTRTDPGTWAAEYALVIEKQPVASENGNFSIPDYVATSETLWGNIYETTKYVFIEDGVTSIGNNAFSNMPILEQVTVEDPSDLTRIGDSAFANDRYLTISEKGSGGRVLSLPNVTEIGERAFLNCTSMGSNGASLVLGSNLASVGKQAFYDTNIKNITFTDLADETSLTIGENAFAHNDIESIKLPEGLTKIGNSAFAYNRFTGSLVIPDSVTSIGDNAFFVSSDNKNQTLTELTLGKNLVHVGESAFRNYMQLATVNVLTTKN